MAEVRLVDLEVIKRFSLAVRQDTASADEVLAALEASRSVVLAALGRSELSAESKPARTRPARANAPGPKASRKPAVKTSKKSEVKPKSAVDAPPAPSASGKAVSTRRRAGRAGRE